jgi:nicotinate-nucleotide--dimethylbenzimidazole phosphoribosyltransferase
MELRIRPPDAEAARLARARQDALVKPRGALGRLEDIACWFAARQGRAIPEALRPAITVFAADHGVAARGVSAYPPEVTAQMAAGFARGHAAINALAREVGANLAVVDVGIAVPLPGLAGVVDARVRAGTADFCAGPAMLRDEARRAMAVGARHCDADVDRGANLLIAGDMGIGNTTAAAALVCAYADAPPEAAVGLGTGIDAAARGRKVAIVAAALARARGNAPPDGLAWLAELGGLEIAAIAGYYVRAAERGVPVLLDGYISAAAALAAQAMAPEAVAWLLASHRSAEQGHGLALARLGLAPLLDLGLRLGEGSGAALTFPLLQASLRLHREMATFADAGISDRD